MNKENLDLILCYCGHTGQLLTKYDINLYLILSYCGHTGQLLTKYDISYMPGQYVTDAYFGC